MAAYLALREQKKKGKEVPSNEDPPVQIEAESIVPIRQTGNMAAYLAVQEVKKNGKEVTNPMRPQLEVPSNEDSPVPTEAESKKRKGRGKTKMDSIHARIERISIPINEKCQPVSTDKKLITRFSLFLGTLGRDYVALNHVSWHKVPDKEALWTYVKSKYEIDERAKTWVMKAMHDAWKVNKSRIKDEHYTPYDNDDDRMANRPDGVPFDEFVDCLKYWNDPEVQAQAKKNSMNRRKNINPHTAGSTSFAQVNHELKIKNGRKEPSKAEMYIVTRKRKQGRKYKSDSSVINYKVSTLENLCVAGATSESVDQALMAGESSHGPNWLVGRLVSLPKPAKTGDVNCSSQQQMPTVDELMAKVNQQVKESLVSIVSQIAHDNPGLKVNLDAISNLVGTEIAADDVASREEGVMQG